MTNPKLYFTLSNALTAIARPIQRWGDKAWRKGHRIKEEQGRRAYLESRGEPTITEPGEYRDRGGRVWTIRPNTEGWLDKLPWTVLNKEGYPVHTVDEWGRIWWHSEHAYDLVDKT